MSGAMASRASLERLATVLTEEFDVHLLQRRIDERLAEDLLEHAIVLVAVLLQQRHDVVAHDARQRPASVVTGCPLSSR